MYIIKNNDSLGNINNVININIDINIEEYEETKKLNNNNILNNENDIKILIQHNEYKSNTSEIRRKYKQSKRNETIITKYDNTKSKRTNIKSGVESTTCYK